MGKDISFESMPVLRSSTSVTHVIHEAINIFMSKLKLPLMLNASFLVIFMITEYLLKNFALTI